MEAQAPSPTTYSLVDKSRRKMSSNDGISESELNLHCDAHTKTCHDKIDSKIKISVMDLRLWIVTSLVVFLLGFGGSVMCGIKQVGNIEERIANQGETIKKLDTQIESLRQEIWSVVPSLRHNIGNRDGTAPPTAAAGDTINGTNNALLPVASSGIR